MGWSELMDKYGCIDYYYSNDVSGVDWLKRLRSHYEYSVWLNPTPREYWRHPTVEAVSRIFPMFPLTLDGLKDAIKALTSKVKRTAA